MILKTLTKKNDRELFVNLKHITNSGTMIVRYCTGLHEPVCGAYAHGKEFENAPCPFCHSDGVIVENQKELTEMATGN